MGMRKKHCRPKLSPNRMSISEPGQHYLQQTERLENLEFGRWDCKGTCKGFLLPAIQPRHFLIRQEEGLQAKPRLSLDPHLAQLWSQYHPSISAPVLHPNHRLLQIPLPS